MALQFGLLLALLSVCRFTPGFYLVRKLSWSPMAKLCGGIGLSLILVYLAAWGVYCFGAGEETPAFASVSIACLVLGVLARKDWLRLFRARRVRQAMLGFGFLLVWTLVILGMIRHYSGLGWGSDWLEHFQRSLFFLHRFPLATPLIFDYQLPARPPMMNVLAAFFLAQTEDLFASSRQSSLFSICCCSALLGVLFLGLMRLMAREHWMPRAKAVPVVSRAAARGSRR